jgi:dipeptide/tripeptide permease
MRGDLFGFIPIAPEAAMSMNPLWCMVAGPIISWIFSSLEERNINLTTATKVAFSFVLTAIAFCILTYAVKNIGSDVIIRPEVFLVIHFFQAFAEVIVGSMVVAFILSVAPKHIESFSVSLVSVTVALSGIIGAVFSTSIALEKDQKITQEIVQNVYGDYFSTLTVWAVVMVVIALLASIVIGKMLAADSNENDVALEEVKA